MKKFFTLIAALLSVGAFAEGTEIVKYAEGTTSVGTLTVVASDATKVSLEYGSKYNKNKTACTVITFASSMTVKDNAPADYYVKATAEGGFKAGDVITFQPFTVMSTNDFTGGSKYANIRIYAGNDEKVAKIFDTESTGEVKTVTDGHEEEGEIKSFTTTLESDCEALYFGRAGGTRINVFSFDVTRDPTAVTAVKAGNKVAKVVKTLNKSGIKIADSKNAYNAAGQIIE